MSEPFRVRFRNFNGLDFSSARRHRMPNAKASSSAEQALLGAAISGLSAAGNTKGQLAANLIERCEGGARMIASGSVPGAIVPSTSEFTISQGLTTGAGAILAYAAGGGIYIWRKRRGHELGLYGSISVGMITNIGASAGVQTGYFFGPAPATLGGESIELAVSVDIGPASIGGSLFISPPSGGLTPPAGSTLSSWLSGLSSSSPPWHPQLLGVAFTLSAGLSVLPADIAVMPGRTWTMPALST